ncbi:MAG TPA: DUF4350 domain-containing protein [Terracidiphilus sp.]|nr:DUF4350 domain-containing protein [Terracidiphilus sp.]
MKFLSSLDRKDRRLVLGCLLVALVLAAVTGFLLPSDNTDDNRLPSSYLSGQHGALAAYETLLRSGYPVERWERPLSELAAIAGPETVVVFAEPFTRETDNITAVREIVERGGRVVATGFWGGYILPGESSDTPKEFSFSACKLEPEGRDLVAGSGEVWMVPAATWQVGHPSDRVQYSCAGQPAVVEYDWGRGHVVWWASSTPLENGSLARAQNLEFFLNSLGPQQGHHFYWDESLHGEIRSNWSFVSGPALTLLRIGLLVLAALVLFSFSRRSGPVRELPPPVRATPIEFIEALGALYRNAGAASTAVSVAWERFRRHALALCGLRGQGMTAAEVASALRRRFPLADRALEADLAACEDASANEGTSPREALRLVQLLERHRAQLDVLAKAAPGAIVPPRNAIFKSQGRAS